MFRETGQTDAQAFGIQWRRAHCSQPACRGLPATGGGVTPVTHCVVQGSADPSLVHDMLARTAVSPL